MLTVGGTSHALVHVDLCDLWESQDLRPGIDLVDPVACGLFPKEIPIVLQLYEGNFSAELDMG